MRRIIVKRVITFLLVLLAVSASFGQGTVRNPTEFIRAFEQLESELAGSEQRPSEPTFQDLTRHVRLTLPGTYFTGPLGAGDGSGFQFFPTTPELIVFPGFPGELGDEGGVFPGVVAVDPVTGLPTTVLGPESSDGLFLISFDQQLVELEVLRIPGARVLGDMPPAPPTMLTAPGFAFVELPRSRTRPLLLPAQGEVPGSFGDGQLTTVPEPTVVVLLSLAGLSGWLLRRRN